jgi:predicted metalloprotease with PDZ domain
MQLRTTAVLSAFLAAFLALSGEARAQTSLRPMTLSVDASQASRNFFRAVATIPVSPGHCAFAYPKWIPAWETPAGPIQNLVSLHVTANGRQIAWHRDPVDMYKFTCDAGNADTVTVSMDVIGSTPADGYNATLMGTANVAVLQWSSVVVYPEGENVYNQPVTASLRLPAGWNGASALTESGRAGDRINFASVMLNRLVDSPFHMGAFHRSIQLSSGESPTYLDIVADSSDALNISSAELAGMKHLVREAPALYGPPHYEAYHFLLSLSDALGGGGFEHHQSSDDRSSEDYLTNEDSFRAGTDLMSHEYSHSWNGKYRRPIGMVIANYNQPMKDDLIWVYEGMNEYLGKLLAVRARLATPEDERAQFADIAALESYRTGRNWRPLIDTAVGAPYLYTVGGPWTNLRRSAGDFYDEGMLVWLDVDTTIRSLTRGRKALDDFLHLYTAGGSREPSIEPYDFDDIVALLNQVVPYDWRGFFEQKIYAVQPQAPLAGLERAGWRLVYREKPTELDAITQAKYHYLNFAYSIGLTLDAEGHIGDIVPGSAADKAGIAPRMTIVAVDGRAFSSDRMHAALATAKRSHRPMDFIVTNGSFYRTYSVPYYDGDRYPALERIPGRPDMLSQIFAPKTFKP